MPSLRNITVLYPGEWVHSFKVINKDSSELELLDDVFAWFNMGSNQERTDFLEARKRSLSVNDFVHIDRNWYQCASMGWTKVEFDYVMEIVCETCFHSLFVQSPWCALDRVMWARRMKEPPYEYAKTTQIA